MAGVKACHQSGIRLELSGGTTKTFTGFYIIIRLSLTCKLFKQVLLSKYVFGIYHEWSFIKGAF
jgi:hypothetical protein